MNVTFASREFLKELEVLVKVVPSKPALPILSNVLIQAGGDGLRLAASDMEVGVISFCAATVVEPGATTLPAKHLLEVVKLLPDREVTLTAETGFVRLTSGKYTSRVPTQSVTEYPTLPSMKDLEHRQVPHGFADMIKRVRFAVTGAGKKYAMDGALFLGHSLVSTDGHRLALATSEVTPETTLPEEVIIPTKGLDALNDILTPTSVDTIFAMSSRHLFFVVDGSLLFTRRLEGKFPNYQKIIPSETPSSAVIPRAALQEAIGRIVLTSEEVNFEFTENVLTLSGRSADIGDAVEQVDIQYDGKNVKVTLNGTYLQDFLKEAIAQTIQLGWKGAGAMMFQEKDYTYIQMPMRTS